MYFMPEDGNRVLSNTRAEHRLQVCLKNLLTEILGAKRHGIR